MATSDSTINQAQSLLSTATTTAIGLSNLILVTPQTSARYQAYARPGPNEYRSGDQLPTPFVFNYDGEQSVTLESDITDHFIEDNSAIQDQIALRPVMITTQGYIGELNDVVPPSLENLAIAVQKLTIISAYTPSISATALNAYNTALQLYQVAELAKQAAISAYSSFGGGAAGTIFPEPDFQNKQQTAFSLFYGWWRQRYLFRVQTPWSVFENMAIKTLRPVQSADCRTFTTFECTFKQIRTAQTITQSRSNVSQARLNEQSRLAQEQGPAAAKATISLGDGLSQIGVA